MTPDPASQGPALDQLITAVLSEKGGIVAILLLIVLGFWKEWIVPGPTVKKKDKTIDTLNEALSVRDRQLERLGEVGRTVDTVLTIVKDIAERRRSRS